VRSTQVLELSLVKRWRLLFGFE